MQSRDDGPATARIVLVGEAYGWREAEMNRPFVGPSYTDKLMPWWTACTPRIIRERDVYITNAWDQGMPARIDAIPEGEMRAAFERCRARVELLIGPDGGGPVVIVPTGNYALYCFTGNGRVSFHWRDGKHERPGIYDWRGSILSYQTNDGRIIKVIPTVHPANTFPMRTPGMEWVCRMDWQRIAEEAQRRPLDLPTYTKMIAPCEAEVREWIGWTRSEADKRKRGERFVERLACSADVETPYKVEYETTQAASTAVTAKCTTCGHTKRWHEDSEVAGGTPPEMARKPTGDDADSQALSTPAAPCSKKGLKKLGGVVCECRGFAAPMNKPKKRKISEEAYLGCSGYAWKTDLAICVPTTLDYWQDEHALRRVMDELRRFHADPNIDFGGQNFGFDAWWYAIHDIPMHAIAWDLMKMHRVQRPFSQWHDLGFQASLDTRLPFWKHEAKLPDEISRWSHNKEQLWAYNCTDNIGQLMLLYVRYKALVAAGRLDYYLQMEAPIDNELLPMSLHGIATDVTGRAEEFERLMGQAKELSAVLNDAAGMPIVTVHKKSGAIIGKIPAPPKLKVFLYEKHKLPIQYKKTKKGNQIKKSVSTDIISIKRLMEAFPGNAELQTVGALVLRHRRLNKKASDLKESKVEANGRMYAIFKQDTLLGRLSSSSTPKDEGANLQNQDHELRRFFVADTGEEAPH